MRIDKSGNIGIGTTNPFYALEVDSDNGIAISGETNKIGKIGVLGSALAGIGTSPGGVGVEGDAVGIGAIGVYGRAIWDATGIGVQGAGNQYDFYATGPGLDFQGGSSIRWKRNIQPIKGALEKVLKLRGVYFDWDKEHGGSHSLGMIGEEVGEVFPEIVGYEADGKYTQGMDYSKLGPILVEAIKELKAQNDALKQRIEALEKRVRGPR